jgi:PAS domain S-box-containing protein
LGKLLIVRDITENKKAEEALRQSTIELEKLAGKLAETNLSLERKVAERTQSLQDSNMQLRQQIAERERAEAERAAEQERLAVTLRSIGDGVITTDTDGNVVLLNQVAEELIGWQHAEALGQPLQQVCRIRDESTQTLLESAAQEALRHNEIVNRPRPTLLVASDGTERLIAESGAPIRAQDGTVIGAVLVFRDVTERRKIEEELVKADRLESIGVLAGGIAHDFNNILTAILGNVSLAKLYAGDNEKLSARLHNAEKASLRAQDLTQQLLTFSKGGPPVKQTASLKELIQESVDFSLRGSNVKCKLDLEEDLWPGHIDAGQISQVIHNLIINADQAMPNGGILSVAAVNTDLRDDRRARLLSLDKGRYVHITIADEGVGIEEERLQKIFDPYFTTKPQGSGLGLFTSYSIIKKHDGHIEAQSTVGVGTTFSIYLPAATDVPVQAEPAPERAAAGTGKILVMEDEESLIEVIGSLLEHYGYDVVFAHDGDETLTTYQQANDLGTPFDALILDLTIPGGMGGKETVTKLLAINPQVKAIVASGYANDPIMSEFRQYGFQGCIAKPYQADALHQVLRQVLAGTPTEPAAPICHSEDQDDYER